LSDLRQNKYNIRTIKKALRLTQKLKRSTSKDPTKQDKRKQIITQSYQDYIGLVSSCYQKIEDILKKLTSLQLISIAEIVSIDYFMGQVKHHLDLVERRVIKEEKIPHKEKVFSIFEPHTEWVSKGKAGTPVEFGLRVNIIEDQHQFILHHQVMEKQTDEQIAVPFINDTQARFENLVACSLDKGFHSPHNQVELKKILAEVVLPKKGRLNQMEKEIQSSESFRKARRQHSAVESAINALEVHGLDKCPDHGIVGFKKYVALAIAARNTQRLGVILRDKELKSFKRRRKKAA